VHELAIAQHLLQVVEDQARQNGAQKVISVRLVIGEHSHVVEETLQLYFDHLTAEGGSVAQGARLRFRRRRMMLRCASCGSDYAPQGDSFNCPRCGQPGKLLNLADELHVESLEVEP